jgi:TM2 domain-containing membrane protein YozV
MASLMEVQPRKNMSDTPGPGSAGNVIAAICSFFIPGLGQLVQGRVLMALIQFVLAGILWIFLLGWLVHLWSVIDAALYRG